MQGHDIFIEKKMEHNDKVESYFKTNWLKMM